MVRTYDLVKEEPEKKSDTLRLSDFEELRIEAEKASAYSRSQVSHDKKDTEEAEKTYEAFRIYMRDVRAKVRNNQPVELEAALILIRKITESREVIETMYQLTTSCGHDEDYFISHSVNNMIYTMKVGLRLGYPVAKLQELALSALLHDIGRFMIPEDILEKKEQLNESELSLIKRHPEMGKNILFAFKDNCPWLIRAVHEHHERENSQGYPQGIKGDAIHEYAKIIGICDSYEAMTHNRPHKKAIIQSVSVKELVGTKNLLFSPRIIKAFLEEISIYPIGSYVQLNNKVVGSVIATNKDQPLKPVIKILFDGHGTRMAEDKIIDLKENPVLSIVSCVSEEDLPQ